RDAHIGVLWEGTSNINALDVIDRAVAKSGGHETLARALKAKLQTATAAPAGFRAEVAELVDRAAAFAGEVASKPRHERLARLATDALYNAASAALMTWEGAATGAAGDSSVGVGRRRDHRIARSRTRFARASGSACDRLSVCGAVQAATRLW